MGIEERRDEKEASLGKNKDATDTEHEIALEEIRQAIKAQDDALEVAIRNIIAEGREKEERKRKRKMKLKRWLRLGR